MNSPDGDLLKNNKAFPKKGKGKGPGILNAKYILRKFIVHTYKHSNVINMQKVNIIRPANIFVLFNQSVGRNRQLFSLTRFRLYCMLSYYIYLIYIFLNRRLYRKNSTIDFR